MEAVAPERFAEAFTCRKVGARRVRFVPTKLEGAYLVELERHEDERGFFARTWCRRRVRRARARRRTSSQCSISRNTRAGTLRGLHFQTCAARGGEARPLHARRDLRRDRRPAAGLADARRVVRCRARRGARQRALRPEGLRARLPDARRRRRGPLHDLRPRTSPEASPGVRWDDPAFGIEWPRGGRADDQRARPVAGPNYARPAAATDSAGAATAGVELVAADLVDPREQLVDVVERVEEPAAELVGRRRSRARRSAARTARRRRLARCPTSGSHRAPGLRLDQVPGHLGPREARGDRERLDAVLRRATAASASVRLATAAFAHAYPVWYGAGRTAA